MSRTLIAACLFLASAALAQQQGPVEITAEPSHHLVIDNATVRAFAVTIGPKASTLMHLHGHDYITVALGDSEILNVREGAQPVAVKFKDGDVRFAPAGVVHAVTNTSDTNTFRNVTIELLGPTTNQKPCTESCSVPVQCDLPDKTKCVTRERVFTSDQWTITLVTLPAGGLEPKHTHTTPYLLIALTDADLKARIGDGPETAAHRKAGDVTWNNPVVHTITNTGSNPTKVVVLEFNGK